MGLAGVGMGVSTIRPPGAGPSGPSPSNPHWHRMAQQSTAFAAILGNQASLATYIAAKEYKQMGGRGKLILWRPFRVGNDWYATARVKTTDTPILYKYDQSGGAGPGPMALGAVPGSAVNSALHPTLRLDEHGVVTLRSLMGIGASDPQAVLDQSLRKWAQLPVEPSPSSPNWKDLSASDLSLLQKQAGWAESVSNAQRMHETMFRFRGSWYQFATTSATGYRVLGGGSGSGGHRSLAGVGAFKATFVPITADDLNATPAGIPLQQAAMALNQYMAASGVPSEHTDNAVVLAFQQAYNADPVSDIHNDASNNGKLDEDGGYGPNTSTVYGVIMGITPPAVNTTPAPAPAPTTPTTPTKPVTSSSYTVPIVAGVLVLAAGGIGYAAYHHKKKGGGHLRHAHA